MSEYTPTTHQIREGYATDFREDIETARRENFDLWLGLHEAYIAKKVLRQAADEARVRGDIGHPEGVAADRWLEGLALRAQRTGGGVTKHVDSLSMNADGVQTLRLQEGTFTRDGDGENWKMVEAQA